MEGLFLDRSEELRALEALWKPGVPTLIVLYGRRRVGKSALLRYFSAKKHHFYWTATKTTSQRLLESFSQEFHRFQYPQASLADGFSYPNWEAALMNMGDYARRRKVFVVLDEFPYAMEAEPVLASLLQKLWDHHFRKSKMTLCLTGSRIGMVEKQILSSQGPLYGRAKGVLWLNPLPLACLAQFFPKYAPSQLVEVYSLTGGIPFYLNIFRDGEPVLATLKQELASPTSLLKTEPYFLIHEEVKEPLRYVAVLEALGRKRSVQAEIAKATGIGATHLMPYLQTLERLRYVKRKVPITENPKASRKGRYEICDFFLQFYFRFLAPHANWIEEGREEKIFDEISSQWEAYVGKTGFEDVCRCWLTSLAKKSALPFDPDIIGSYWDNEMEINVAAINRKHRACILAEAKWTASKCDLPVLAGLNEKAERFSKKHGYHAVKMIFARSGFTERLCERARIENVRLVPLSELL